MQDAASGDIIKRHSKALILYISCGTPRHDYAVTAEVEFAAICQNSATVKFLERLYVK